MLKKKAILIADDEYINRAMLVNMLKDQYDIFEAENGEEALEVLSKNASLIVAVVLDLIMPKMDGYEFLKRYQNYQEFRNIPVIVATVDSNVENEKKCLAYGVWDFVVKPYDPQIIRFRIENAIERGRIQAADYDTLTGLYSPSRFFRETRKMLSEHSEETFVFIRLDIDRFKLINTFYGLSEGDRLLKYIANRIQKLYQFFPYGTYGRLGGDIFCFCQPYRDTDVQRIIDAITTSLMDFSASYYIEPSMGIYVIEDNTLDVPVMYDRASLAAKGCKGKYMQYVAYYDNSMNESMVKEQVMINEMDSALEREEFVVYLQPKYSLKTNQPFGAEALVRWNHPEKGMISPGVFIPVFERNGFIGKLDYYMWEKVCQLLRKWIDEGQDPAPISVNVSRVNIYDPQLVDKIEGLMQKYHIPPRLLNLELTESAFIENQEVIKETITRFREKGFVILMDDFGSGYSSLNVLKDIEMDILKIDMKFLPNGVSNGRSEKILTSIVRMAKWLEVPVIMEGVETEEQDDFLRSIDVDYIQGYFYARPMPVEDYEELIRQKTEKEIEKTEKKALRLFSGLGSADAHVKELFEKLTQPVLIFQYRNGSFEFLGTNSAYNKCMDYTGMEGQTYDFFQYVDNSEKEKIFSLIEDTIHTAHTGECDYMRFDSKGNVKWMRVKVQLLTKTKDTMVLMGLFTDITELKKFEKELERFENTC